MKSLPLLLSTATLAVVAAATHVRAADLGLGAYLESARQAATARVEAANIPLQHAMVVQGRVNSDGRIYDVHVAVSSGSLETDTQVMRALRRLKTPEPPAGLIGAKVSLGLGPSAVAQAANR